MDGMFGDAPEDVGEVGLRVDAVHLGSFGEGVDAGGALASGAGSAEEIDLSSMQSFA